MTNPRIFAQWRPRRTRQGDKRAVDYSEPLLYICAYWHKGNKQGGRSFSAEKHGLEEAARKAIQEVRKATGLRLSISKTLEQLTW